MRKGVITLVVIVALVVSVLAVGNLIVNKGLFGDGVGLSPAEDSLVAHYEFEDNVEDSAGNHDGEVNGDVSFVKGRLGKAISLNGESGNYVDVPLSEDLQISGAMTVSAWVYNEKTTAENTGWGLPISTYTWRNDEVNNNGRGWTFGDDYGTADEFYFRVWDGNKNSAIAIKKNVFAQFEDEWVHIVGVFKPRYHISLYINGEIIDADMADIPREIVYGDPLRTLRIGARADSENRGKWKGRIDDVRIYDTNLGNSQVKDLYESASKNLIAHFDFEGDVLDSSVNHYDGSVKGDVSFVSDRGGQVGRFDGNSYVEIEGSEDLDFEEFTMSAWIKKDSDIGNWKRIMGKYSYTGDNRGWAMDIESANNDGVRCYIVGDNGGISKYLPEGSVPKDEWIHVACTFDGNELRMFVNGEKSGDPVSFAGKTFPKTDSPIMIGSTYWNGVNGESPFKGDIDDVRIYDTNLLATQVRELYESEGDRDGNEDGGECKNRLDDDGDNLFDFADETDCFDSLCPSPDEIIGPIAGSGVGAPDYAAYYPELYDSDPSTPLPEVGFGTGDWAGCCPLDTCYSGNFNFGGCYGHTEGIPEFGLVCSVDGNSAVWCKIDYHNEGGECVAGDCPDPAEPTADEICKDVVVPVENTDGNLCSYVTGTATCTGTCPDGPSAGGICEGDFEIVENDDDLICDVVWGTKDCEGIYHAECVGNWCIPILGAGQDQCNLLAVTCDTPQHTICENNMCEIVEGDGPLTCLPGPFDCSIIDETYGACFLNTCLEFPKILGNEVDECLSDPTICDGPHQHTKCINNMCEIVEGNGPFDYCFPGAICGIDCFENPGEEGCPCSEGLSLDCSDNLVCDPETWTCQPDVLFNACGDLDASKSVCEPYGDDDSPFTHSGYDRYSDDVILSIQEYPELIGIECFEFEPAGDYWKKIGASSRAEWEGLAGNGNRDSDTFYPELKLEDNPCGRVYDCRCDWNSPTCGNKRGWRFTGKSDCIARSECVDDDEWCATSFGSCRTTLTTPNDCDASGNFLVSWTAVWTDEFGVPHAGDTITAYENDCTSDNKNFQCRESGYLPFFTLMNLLIAMFLVLAIYCFAGYLREKRKNL